MPFTQSLRSSFLTPFAAALLLCACSTQDDACVEQRSPLAFTEPGPWDLAPAQVYAHVQGSRSGTIQWLGGGELGDINPGEGEATLSLTTTLDPASALRVDNRSPPGARLACIDSLELGATVAINSGDGALAEQLELELLAFEGQFAGQIEGMVLLNRSALAGQFSWTPSDAEGELFLRLSWIDDADQTVRGWLIWGDTSETSVEAGVLLGSGRVLAQFEALAQLP